MHPGLQHDGTGDQNTVSENQGISFFESEITIKDEPLCFDSSNVHGPNMANAMASKWHNECDMDKCANVPVGVTYCDYHEVTSQLQSRIHEIKSTSPKIRKSFAGRVRGCSRYYRQMLQCPQCPMSFRHGPFASGLESLMGHVYENHKRLKCFSMSVVREKYAVIVKDALKRGYLNVHSGLLPPQR